MGTWYVQVTSHSQFKATKAQASSSGAAQGPSMLPHLTAR